MLRRPAPFTVPLALAAWLGAPPTLARGDEAPPSTTHYTIRGELGAEIDTNVHRSESINTPGAVNDPAVASPLGRAVLSGALSDVLGAGHQVGLAATVAAKSFWKDDALSENVAIAEGSALWRKALDQRWGTSFIAGYYEAFQRFTPDQPNDQRDFRSVTPTLRLTRLFGDNVDAGMGGGYRWFVYKPDHSLDFNAPTVVMDARWARETEDGAADWEVTFRGGYEHRIFAGRQLIDGNPTCTTQPNCPPVNGPETRVDNFLTTAFDVARTGRVLLGGGYGLHVNLSNSYGESVLRHFITARFAAALPLDLYLAARIEVVFARYADQVYVAGVGTDPGLPHATIDDESRNTARVELSRSLSDRLQLIARYNFYANELSKSDVTYRRQTALLSLSFALER
jgi:hypothetical protein